MVTQLMPTRRNTPIEIGRLPISAKSHQELLAEIGRINTALTEALSRRGRELQGGAEESGSTPETEVLLLASRLETLNRAAAASTIVNQNGQIVVGSRVTVRRSNALKDATYELVAPGMSDVRLGRISSDSALGSTLIGRGPNEEAIFQAPGGAQRLMILEVR
jgi:transcription elongation GreA/GreB family factor